MVDIKVLLERKFSLVTPSQDSEFDEGWLNAYWAQKGAKAGLIWRQSTGSLFLLRLEPIFFLGLKMWHGKT